MRFESPVEDDRLSNQSVDSTPRATARGDSTAGFYIRESTIKVQMYILIININL